MSHPHRYCPVVIFLLFSISLVVLGYPASYLINGDNAVAIYRVQIASRTTANEALQIQKQVLSHGISNIVLESTGTGKWRVIAGPWPTKSDCSTTLALAKSMGYPDAYIITKDISVDQAKSMNLPLQDSEYRLAVTEASTQTRSSAETAYNRGLSIILNASASDPYGLAPAIPYFAQAIAWDPGSVYAEYSRYNLGKTYVTQYWRLKQAKQLDPASKLNLLTAAVDVLSEYLRTSPAGAEVAAATKQLADCQHALSEYRTDRLFKTAKSYQKIIDSYSDSTIGPAAHLEYAGVIFELASNRMYSWDSVRAELVKVQTIYPKVERRIQSRAMAMHAETSFWTHDYYSMITGAQAVIETYPEVTVDMALSHYLIGRGELELGQYPEALTKFEFILNTYPETEPPDRITHLMRVGALFGQARCYVQSGDTTRFNMAINEMLTKYTDTEAVKCIRNLWGISTTIPVAVLVNAPMPFSGMRLAQVRSTP